MPGFFPNSFGLGFQKAPPIGRQSLFSAPLSSSEPRACAHLTAPTSGAALGACGAIALCRSTYGAGWPQGWCPGTAWPRRVPPSTSPYPSFLTQSGALWLGVNVGQRFLWQMLLHLLPMTPPSCTISMDRCW